MGIAKSLRKANFLQPLSDAVKELARKKQYEEGLNKLVGLYSQTGENIDKQFEPSLSTIFGTKTQKGFAPAEIPVNPLQRRTGVTGVAEQPTNVPEPTFETPIERTIQKPVDYGQAQRNAFNQLNDTNVNALKLLGETPELQNMFNYLSSQGGQRIQRNMPVKPERVTTGEGAITSFLDPYTGNEVNRIENVKDFKAQGDKELDTFTGSDDQRYTTLQRADGTTYTINTITGEPAPEGVKVKDSGSDSPAWAKYFTGLKEEEEKKRKEAKEAQAKYDAAQNAPFVPVTDLIARGLVKKEDVLEMDNAGQPKYRDKKGKPKYKYAGAYINQNKSGNPVLSFTDEEQDAYSEKISPNAPKKWKKGDKKKKEETKKETPQFEEGKIYRDARGNKAIYRKGKWEEID